MLQMKMRNLEQRLQQWKEMGQGSGFMLKNLLVNTQIIVP